MDKKKYIDVLTEQADKHSRPQELALSDFCDYLIEFFSIDAFKAGTVEYSQHIVSCTEQNPEFAVLALQWLGDVATAMNRGEWLDVFGILYEEMYLSRGKVKVDLALVTGKKDYDKRDDMAARDAKREIDRAMKERSR